MKLKDTLARLPPMDTMMSMAGARLKETLDRQDILAYPLLEWSVLPFRSLFG